VLEEKPLDPAAHDRKSFDCGVPELNDYLQRLADQHRRKGIATTFVLVDSDLPSEILGYYSLSAAQVDVGQLADADRKKLPRYPIPCFRIGRLATSKSQQGKGIGKLLLACAVERGLNARRSVAGYALIVDAKNEQAKSFYIHFGFFVLNDSPLTLYLPLGK
jgi:GNAT superfamily N-acetyltransferase